ncbi:MAG: DUF1285 domain-containing protein [Pseudomonadota bacterium]
MNDLMRYASDLAGVTGEGGVPNNLDKWDPPFCGDIDLVIRSDGTWAYCGTPIGRARLVRLFSTVLRKEDDKYFLVTPVEKLGITVEEAPFLAVLVRAERERNMRDQPQRLVFTTNVGDEVVVDADHGLCYRERPDPSGERGTESAPYLHVRSGLEALVARSVVFDLVDLGEQRHINGLEWFGVSSCGVFFPFAPASDINGLR